jgi:hypothetical protein
MPSSPKTSPPSETPAPARPITPEQSAFLALLEGNTEAETAEAIAFRFPRCKIADVLAAAKEQFRRAARQDPEVLTGWALCMSQDLARKMLSVGDYAGALKAVKQISDIANRQTQARAGKTVFDV